MLNEMRFGRMTQKSIALFKSLSREVHYEDGIAATELYALKSSIAHFLTSKLSSFPRREDVDRSNSGRMHKLSTQQQTYRASDGGSLQDKTQREKVLANFMAPAELTLKVDAQVMLIKNIDETLVNGSIGKIISFMDPAQAKNEGLYEDEGPADSSRPKPKPKQGQLWPVVAFSIPGGYTKEVMVVPEQFKVELPDGEVQVSRTQVRHSSVLSRVASTHAANSFPLFSHGPCPSISLRARRWIA